MPQAWPHYQLAVGPQGSSFSLGLNAPTCAAKDLEDDLEGSFPLDGSINVYGLGALS